MPQKKTSRRLVTPLLLFTLAGWALWAIGRNTPAQDGRGDDAAESLHGTKAGSTPTRATWSKRRLATSLAFATLFFGGAAFSAGAGDVVAEALEGETTTEMTSTEEAPAEEAPAEEAPAEEAPAEDPPAEEAPAEEAPAEETPADPDAPAEPGDPGEETPGEPGDGGESPAEPGGGGSEPGEGTPPPPLPTPDDPDEGEPAPAPPPGVGEGAQPAPPGNHPVLDPGTRSPAQLDPEANAEGFFATIWLHRPLPDPTPPAKRLTPRFARALASEARAARVDWALVLGVLRARGFDGGSLARSTVRSTARQLASFGARRHPRAALARYGDEFAKQAFALRNYNRAVGIHALVSGFEAAKPELQKRVLKDKRLSIYQGGRLDIALGRTDIRVLVLLRYLAETHGQATVSSLTSGHGFYSRPGVVSAHSYGLAVDVAGVAKRSIYGNQEPGGLTERAVRNILLLPSELQPKQVISLLGLGGPSFPMADHYDHIHVGY
jgi:hypothetical protein